MKDFFKPNKVIIIALIVFFFSLILITQLVGGSNKFCFDEASCRPSMIDVVISKILWLIFIPLGLVLHSIGDYLGIRGGFFELGAILFSALAYVYLISCIINFIIYKIRTRKEVISDEKRKSDAIISVFIIVAIIIAGIIDIIYSQKL